MIHIGLDPTIVKTGALTVGWHGVMMFLGTVTAVGLTLHLGRKIGIKDETVYSAALLAVVFGFIGARVTHVIDNWGAYYADRPGKIFAVTEGGLGWYGALIGGTIAVAVYSRIAKFSLGRFADAAVCGVFLGLSIGRIGCTLNGDAAGGPTSLPWGLIYTHPDSFAPHTYATHPSPVYEILWNMVILVILWRLWRRLTPEGSLFLVGVALYAVGRFAISWSRAEESVLGPLHQSHLISVGLFLFALVMLAVRKTRLVKPQACEAPTPGGPPAAGTGESLGSGPASS